MARIRITQSRSEIGHPASMRRTLRALGLRGYQRTIEQEDTPQIRGMIRQVSHLVTVGVAESGKVRAPARGRRAPRAGAGTRTEDAS